jgi:hypothetical protein
MVVSSVPATSRLRAEVNYVRNPPHEGAEPLTFVAEAERLSTMQTLPGRSVWIHDVRGLDSSLDREGFVLVEHASEVPDFEAIQQDPEIDRLYVDEITDLLVEVTGAARAIVPGSAKKRYGESETEKLAKLREARAGHVTPARYPHRDVTDDSGPAQAAVIVGSVPGLQLEDYSRWALYNVWRSIRQPPQDFPLAVCDARTVDPVDGVTVVAVTQVPRVADDIRHDTTGYLYNPEHHWCYFRDMTPDEALIFKTHDTDPTRAHGVPHTAFTDPTCPSGTPTRASVEIRGLALFR